MILYFRIGSLLSTRLRTNYLRTVSPSLPKRTFQFLQHNVGFGDWLILVMMAIHLDIKLFSDILEEIGDSPNITLVTLIHFSPESVGRSEEQSLGVSLSTGLDTEDTEQGEKLRRVASRGCLSTNMDMLTLKVRLASHKN